MMILAEVLIERSANALNRPFTYRYNLSDELKKGVRVIVEFAHKQVIGYVLDVKSSSLSKEEYEEESGFALNDIISVIDKEAILTDEMLELAKEVASYYLCPLIAVLQTMLPPSLKPRYSSLKKPKIHYDKYLTILDNNEEELTDKQIEVLRLISMNKQVLKRDIKSKSIIDKLIKLNRIKEIKIEVNRFKVPSYLKEEKKILTKDQNEVIYKIFHSANKVSLLEGVTGSGKTEVYLSLTERILKENKNVIILVPEISLTGSMMKYFLKRFDKKVAILHSELTDAEKYDEYRRIAKGEAKIVVGARSAIFAPLKNIGLIILDEEHVESYKQDNIPFYHARDIALIRANKHNAYLVFGSATPLLETRARALKGVYNYVTLKQRINKMDLPKTYIVDMLNAKNVSSKSYMFSNLLLNKISDRLAKHEQVILLVNRRGYSSSVMCRNCRNVIKCPTCHIPLIFHTSDNMLKCHHCGHVMKMIDVCPNCGSKYFTKLGFGSERIEKEINKLFPHARTLRLDSDVGKVRNNIYNVLDQFSRHEADILIGTQMVAKGHDFPSVTLVGIVLADVGLSIPSFRSPERTFTLITQAIGRSGRKDLVGEAILQTYNPNNYAIALASKQDFDNFYFHEMKTRKMHQYPPFTYLISLAIKGKNKELVEDIAYLIASDLNRKNYQDVSIIGPSTPFIAYKNNQHIRQILIKYKKIDEIKKYLENLLLTYKNKSNISLSINVDPYDY